jgi:hypothetical protein
MSQPVIERVFKHNGERLLDMLRRQHPEYHPIVSIARIAHAAEDAQDSELALRAHATVLKYVEPELKAIEIKDNLRERRTIEVSLFREVREDGESDPPAIPEMAQPGGARLANVIDITAVPTER